MNQRDKEAWLEKHGHLHKTPVGFVQTGRWRSNGGLIMSTTEDDYIDYLYSAIKETLFTRFVMMRNGRYVWP